jgi:hypothetical protein
VFLPSEGMHKIYSPPNTSLHGSDGVKSGLPYLVLARKIRVRSDHSHSQMLLVTMYILLSPHHCRRLPGRQLACVSIARRVRLRTVPLYESKNHLCMHGTTVSGH